VISTANAARSKHNGSEGGSARRGGPMPFGSPKVQEISSYVADSRATLGQMKTYRGFPERLHHRVPHWVESGALLHIRIGLEREKQQRMLIDPFPARQIDERSHSRLETISYPNVSRNVAGRIFRPSTAT